MFAYVKGAICTNMKNAKIETKLLLRSHNRCRRWLACVGFSFERDILTPLWDCSRLLEEGVAVCEDFLLARIKFCKSGY
jgi:hypothetical protein